MKTRSWPNPHSSSWLPKPAGSGAYRHWLADAGSLTSRLQAGCGCFSVERLRQGWGFPERDEAALLGMRHNQRALLREVTLCCDGRAVVFAHSVLPRASLRGEWQHFKSLGSRPLGAALFGNPQVVRTPLTFCKLTPRHALYRRALAGVAGRPECLWARRSVFTLRGAAILVTEVFLPELLVR